MRRKIGGLGFSDKQLEQLAMHADPKVGKLGARGIMATARQAVNSQFGRRFESVMFPSPSHPEGKVRVHIFLLYARLTDEVPESNVAIFKPSAEDLEFYRTRLAERGVEGHLPFYTALQLSEE